LGVASIGDINVSMVNSNDRFGRVVKLMVLEILRERGVS
jgi:hypothetical protein